MGKKFSIDNIQAAILSFKLKSYETVINRRREVAGIYQERLSDLDELQLPAGPVINEDNFDTYQNYELQGDNRNQLQSFLLLTT